jgi:hypothetical protein
MAFLNFFNQETLYTIMSIYFVAYFVSNDFRELVTWPVLYVRSKLMLESGNRSEDDTNNDTNDCLLGEEERPEPKYEDKYLEDIRKLSKEFIFDENEEKLIGLKFIEFHTSLMEEEYFDKLKEIRTKMDEIAEKLTKYEGSDDDYCICDDDNDEDLHLGETKKERVTFLLEEQNNLRNKENELKQEYESDEGIEKFIKRIDELSKKFVIDERLDKLKNNFVMEKTPLGNVLMLYNNKRGSFEFYSDNTIPYRYLEPVSRKYVKMFDCRPIYCDMEEELKNSEQKLEEKEKEEKEKEEKKKQEEEDNKKNNVAITVVDTKKNVFAKFKSYNKESGTGHVNIAAPPKNSIPNNKVTATNSNEKVLLKENANRYSYEGKLSNFNFLKKIDRKVVDKKYGMTFADFKRLQEENKNK